MLTLALILLLAGDATPPAKAKRSEVERIIDGDTLVLKGYGRSRLIGVDAPETLAGRHGKQWRCGFEATAVLKELVPPGTVVLVQRTGTDVYDRPLVYLWRADDPKVFVNAGVVQSGYARIFKGRRFARQPVLEEAENSARKREAGLWSPGQRDCAPVK